MFVSDFDIADEECSHYVSDRNNTNINRDLMDRNYLKSVKRECELIYSGHYHAKGRPMKVSALKVCKRVEITHTLIKFMPLCKQNCKETTDYEKYGLTTYDSTERYPRSVIKFSKDIQKSAIHPTQKPVGLLEYLIKTYTNEGELVLDNCVGSGSTCVLTMFCTVLLTELKAYIQLQKLLTIQTNARRKQYSLICIKHMREVENLSRWHIA